MENSEQEWEMLQQAWEDAVERLSEDSEVLYDSSGITHDQLQQYLKELNPGLTEEERHFIRISLEIKKIQEKKKVE